MLLSQALPAFFFSCTSVPEQNGAVVHTPLATRSEGTGGGEGLDLFFFDADGAMSLDAWQHVDGPVPAFLDGRSRSGIKRLAAVSGLSASREEWAGVLSWKDYADRTVALEEENPAAPVMTAFVDLKAGQPASLVLKPLLAEIRLRSLCCDFHDRPYAGSCLDNIRVYPVHVRDRCRLGGESIPSWVNDAASDPERTAALRFPEMLLQTLDGAVGDVTVFPEISLYVYPNPAMEDALGSPRTLLVIEGTLCGRTCYYPIPVVPLEGGASHVFDVTLTRLGTDAPDVPVSRDMLRLLEAVAPWNEMEPVIENF